MEEEIDRITNTDLNQSHQQIPTTSQVNLDGSSPGDGGRGGGPRLPKATPASGSKINDKQDNTKAENNAAAAGGEGGSTLDLQQRRNQDRQATLSDVTNAKMNLNVLG